RTKHRYQRTFNHMISHVPYLQCLVHPGGMKAAELNSLVKEVRALTSYSSQNAWQFTHTQMKALITHIRSEDGCCLCKVVGTYAASYPDKQVVQPPVSADTKTGHSRMGFAHSELGALLCPVKYLQEYKTDPHMCVYPYLVLATI
ncbi:hypothetical protein J3R83DRAFT_8317, partial [Lanmaoa asiatica]